MRHSYKTYRRGNFEVVCLFKETDVLLMVIFSQPLFTLLYEHIAYSRIRACYILSASESRRAIYRRTGEKKKTKRISHTSANSLELEIIKRRI